MTVSPKKVLFVHHFPSPGGSSTSMLTLIRHLDPARFTASVLVVHPVAEPILSKIRAMGIEAEHLPIPLVWDSSWVSRDNIRTGGWKSFAIDERFATYLQEKKPDIVHINDVPSVCAGITAAEAGIPLIWHTRIVLRKTWPLIHPARRVIRTIENLAGTIVAISESEAEQFHSEKINVVYNPLDFAALDRALGKGPGARRALGLDQGDFVVTAPIPMAVHHKGGWDFLRACGVAAKLAPEIPFRFLVAGLLPRPGRRHLLRKWTGVLGPRPDMDRAHALVKKLGIADRTQFTGFREDIYEIMDASDLIVFPSHMRACGRACFEAGALHKPILVTMPTKNTGVVLDGETGLIFPEKDPQTLGRAITELALDRGRVLRMGEAGYAHVRRSFGAELHAGKVMELYDRLGAGA